MKLQPNRDRILSLFTAENIPQQLHEIARSLEISSDSSDYEILKMELKVLCEQKLLAKSSRRRYTLVTFDAVSTIEGIVVMEKDATYVQTDSVIFPKIHIKKHDLNTAFNGDKVTVRIHVGKKKNKVRGEIVRIINRADPLMKGVIELEEGLYFFIPDEEKYYVDFLVRTQDLNDAEHGDRVSARLVSWDDSLKSPIAEVTEILSNAQSQGFLSQEDLDGILDEFNLPKSFPPKVVAEANAFAVETITNEIKNRLDLRKEIIITIDPEDAKDFDDALSMKLMTNGNWEVGVHIADVSHYVTENSLLDKEALNRGTSVYLADRVVPMLPEELSNELCSLKPKRVRLAHSVIMELTPKGEVVNYKIAESVIKSTHRFSYDEVQVIIESGIGPHSELVLNLHKMAKIKREKRFLNGGVDFFSMEVKFRLDENNNPTEAIVRSTTDATSLVEEFMLLANKIVAGHVTNLSKKYSIKPILPFIYRVHDVPQNDKLTDMLAFIKILQPSLTLKGRTSKQVNEFVKHFNDLPEKNVVHQLLLRTMSKAEYHTKNIGHYGLGFDNYTHFTSPIRRYPDLVVHRLIKEYSKEKPSRQRIKFFNDNLEEMAIHCTQQERLSMEAERASTKMMQTAMARKYLGKVVTGTVSGVIHFGLFVLIDEFYGEGLLHIRDLKDDYYHFDERNFRYIGRHTKKVIQLGKRLKVRIYHVDLESRKVDLEFVELIN